MTDPWICWLYFYAVGFTLVAASVFAVLKSGAAKWSLWTDRRLLVVLLLSMTGISVIHAVWIHWASQ